MKYLFIFEDGTFMLGNDFKEEDLDSISNGQLTIIDMDTQCSIDEDRRQIPIISMYPNKE